MDSLDSFLLLLLVQNKGLVGRREILLGDVTAGNPSDVSGADASCSTVDGPATPDLPGVSTSIFC